MKNRFLFLFMFLLLFLWPLTQALAAGTPAGTIITNQAYVDYNDANGNPLTRVFSNTVTTTVSQVAGVSVDPATATKTGLPDSNVGYVVSVQNTGNGTDTIDLAAASVPTWTTVIYADDNQDGVWDPGTETTVISDTGPLAADSFVYVVVVHTVPLGTAADVTSTATLTATSGFDSNVTDSGDYTTTVQDAVLEVTKAVSDTNPAPGDIITYAITGKNTGNATAYDVIAEDFIPANTTYVPGSIRVGPIGGEYSTAAAQTDAAGDDAAEFDVSNDKVVLTWGDEDPYPPNGTGSGGVFYFQVQVDAAVAAGTVIINKATASFALVSGSSIRYSYTSNDANATVANAAVVSVTPGTTSASGDPGDPITYAIVVDNGGNAADVIDVTYTSSEGWTWNLWYDANDDGIAGNDGDYLLTDTDGDGVVDTGNIPNGGSASILATTTIPAGTSNGTVDTLVVTGTSSIDTNISDTTGNLATTVTAPVLAITKSVSPTGNQPPNTILTYEVTVTNNGTGVASAVIITDIIPTFTTYVPGSIKTGATSADLLLPAAVKTDAADGDGAEYDSGSNAVVAGGASKTLGAGGTFILQFQVTID